MKKILLFFLALSSIFLFSARAQTPQDIIVGTGTSSSYYPFTSYKYAWHQAIYAADDIGFAGTISKISYYKNSTAKTLGNIKIYMGTTTMESHTSSTAWIDTADLTLVFDDTLTMTAASGWFDIPLTTSFVYDGNENLVVVVSNGSGNNTSNPQFQYTSTTNGCLYRSSSYTSYANFPGTNYGTTSSYQPNIKLALTLDPNVCNKPGRMVFNTIEDHSISVSWNKKLPTDNAWDVVCVPAGATIEGATLIPLTDTTYTFPNLYANTLYDIYVRTNCGNENYSFYRKMTVRTACGSYIESLPYIENFDSYGNDEFPTCWLRNNTKVEFSTTSQSEPQSLHFSGTTDHYYTMAVLPPVSPETNVSDLKISFDLYKSSSAHRIMMGVMDNPLYYPSFVAIDTFSPADTYDWENFEVSFASYEGTGKYIAFIAVNNQTGGSNSIYLDNVVVDNFSCLNIHHLAVNDITDLSATISWETNDVNSSYEYCYGAVGTLDTNALAGTVTTELSAPLTGLTQSTAYDVYVRTTCSNNTFGVWKHLTFTTPATPAAPATIPYTCDFEDLTENDNWSLLNNTYSESPNAWFIGTATATVAEEHSLYISNDSLGNNNTYSNNKKTTVWAYRDFIATGDPAYKISFDWKMQGEDCCDYLRVYAGAQASVTANNTGSITAPTGSVLLAQLNSDSTWNTKNITVELGDTYPQGALLRLYFMWKCDQSIGPNPAGAIDNLVITTTSCTMPDSVTVSDITANSAAIGWMADENISSWQIVCASGNFDPDTMNITTVSENPYTLNNLLPLTVYKVYVRSACEGTEYSDWTAVVTFSTPTTAVPATIPYECGFEDADENANWTLMNNDVVNSNSWYIGSATASTGSNALYIDSLDGTTNIYDTTAAGSVWAFRDFTLSNAPRYIVSFDWKCKAQSSTDYAKMYLGTPAIPVLTSTNSFHTPSGASAITSYLSNQETWTRDTVILDASSEDYNTVKRLYILWKNNSTIGAQPPISIDNIAVTPIYCVPPTNITVAGLTTTSASITFTSGYVEHSEWEVQYKLQSDENYDTTFVYEDSVALDNLMASTAYQYRIRTVCGDDEYSEWTTVGTFTTPCLPHSVPYSEDFNNYTATSYSTSGVMPDCWNKIYGGSSTGYAPHVCNYSSYSPYGSSTNYYLMFMAGYSSSYTTPNKVILPEFSLPLNELQISFKARINNLTDSYLKLGYITSDNEFTPLVIVPCTTAVAICSTTVYTYPLNIYEFPAGARLAFEAAYTGTSSYTRYIGIDDITVSTTTPAAASCPEITEVHADNITTNTATISWLPNNDNPESNITAWTVLVYSATDTDPEVYDTIVNYETVTQNSYDLTNLMPGTYYYYKVQASCQNINDSSSWEAGGFRTYCDVIANLPYIEDFNPTSSTRSCWRSNNANGDNVSWNWWYITDNTNVFPGIQTGGTNGWNNDYYISPAIELTGDQYLSLEAFVFSHNNPSNFEVLISTTGRNPEDFTEAVIPNTVITNLRDNPWSSGQVDLSAYTGTVYFAFHIPPYGYDANDYLMIDNFKVANNSLCPRITNLTVSNITSDGANLAWNRGANETEWRYEVYPTSGTPTGSLTPATDSTAILSGLSSNTNYTVRVYAVCPGYDPIQLSEPIVLQFRTTCESQTIPYSENFDGYSGSTYNTAGDVPTCWESYTTSTNYPAPHIIGSGSYWYKKSAPNALVFTTGAAGSDAYAMLPPLTDPLNTLELSFWMATESNTNGKLMIGYLTGADYSSFVGVDTIPASSATHNSNGGSDYHVALTDFPADASKIVLKWYYNSSFYSCCIDNVLVETYMPCDRPTDVEVSDITQTTANATWSGSGASAWQILYGPTGTVDLTSTPTSVQDSSFDMSLLTPGTSYDVYVRTDCGTIDGYSNWVLTPFTTWCDPRDIPYTENFDAVAVDNLPACWITPLTYTSGSSIYPRVSSTYSMSTPRSLAFRATSTQPNLAVMQAISHDIQDIQLAFDYKISSNSNPGMFEVIIMGNPTDETSYEIIDTIIPDNSTYNTYRYFFRPDVISSTGTDKYIGFRYTSTSSSSYSAYMDNVEVTTLPTCYPISELTIEAISSTGVTLSWTPGYLESSWNIMAVSASGDTISNEQNITVSDINNPSYTVNNLTPNTDYTIYVQASCADGSTGLWSEISATTLCASLQNLPVTEDFELCTAQTMPLCWSRPASYGTSPTYPSVHNASTYAHSASQSLRFATTTSNGPVFAVVRGVAADIETLYTSFYLKKSSSSYVSRLDVGIMSNPLDTSTFELVRSITPTSTSYDQYFVYFSNVQTTGPDKHVAFRFYSNSSSGYFNLDDLVIDVAPSCIAPLATTNGIGATTADIAWESYTTTSVNWQVAYREANTATWTFEDATQSPHTIQNLTPSTTYEAKVRQICSATDTSNWSNVVEFTTPCLAFDLPFVENFDNITSGIPDCWNNDEGTTTSESYKWKSYSPGYSGRCLRFNSYGNSTGKTNMLKTPDIDLTGITHANLSFWYKNPTGGDFSVYVSTDGGFSYTSNVIATNLVGVSNWTEGVYSLDNYCGNEVVIVFKGTSNYGSNDAYIYLDSVAVNEFQCTVPTALSVSAVATTTATATWSAGGNESSWNVQYKIASATEWTEATVTAPTYNLTGLTANTAYDLRVRAVCDATNSSDWATTTFTTSCAMPTDLIISTITGTSATLSWTQEAGTATEWTLNYRRAEAGATWTTSTISTNPYTIVDLVEHTSYEVQIRANCSSGAFSDYTPVESFTTTSIEDYALENSISLFPNPTSSYLDVKFSDNIQVSELKVYDVYGKLLQTITVNENPTRINVSSLADGVYFVRAITENGIANKSFIKR